MDRFKDLKKALEAGDREKELFLTKDMTPYKVRDTYSNLLGTHIADNYDIDQPEDLKQFFRENQNVKNAKIIGTDQYKLKGKEGLYLPEKNKIYYENSLIKPDAASTIVHELGHSRDFFEKNDLDKYLNKMGYSLDELREKLNRASNSLGLSKAEEFLSGHHSIEDLFEREALEKIMKGGKLAVGAVAPVIKGSAIGGAALLASGIGSKAMAGDFKGAAVDAADLGTDLIPVVGEIKDAIRPTPAGLGSDKTDWSEPYDFSVYSPEEAKDRRFIKIKKLLER